jgi:hypothetical protein
VLHVSRGNVSVMLLCPTIASPKDSVIYRGIDCRHCMYAGVLLVVAVCYIFHGQPCHPNLQRSAKKSLYRQQRNLIQMTDGCTAQHMQCMQVCVLLYGEIGVLSLKTAQRHLLEFSLRQIVEGGLRFSTEPASYSCN